MKQTPKNWALFHLRNYSPGKDNFDAEYYIILYSAKDTVTVLFDGVQTQVDPENFFFIPPGTVFWFDKKYETAFVFGFDQNLFLNRLELLYQIKNGNLFKSPLGLAVKNDFFPYELILEHYYLPVRRPGASQLIRKNSLLNFLEFILIRILLSSDSEMRIHSQRSYEHEIADRFAFILAHEEAISMNATYYAEQLNITKRSLDNAIKDVFGYTAKKYLINFAIERAKYLLATGDQPIKQISDQVGYSQESNFVNFFKKNTGITPGQFRSALKQGASALNFMKETPDQLQKQSS